MDRIDELKAQRAAIDDEIRRLENQTISFGMCRFDKDQHKSRREEWFLAIRTNNAYRENSWQYIIRSHDKPSVICKIKDLINDLQEILERIGENGEN